MRTTLDIADDVLAAGVPECATGGRFVAFDRRVLPETVNRAQPRNVEIIG